MWHRKCDDQASGMTMFDGWAAHWNNTRRLVLYEIFNSPEYQPPYLQTMDRLFLMATQVISRTINFSRVISDKSQQACYSFIEMNRHIYTLFYDQTDH